MTADPEEFKAPSGDADHVEHKPHFEPAPVAQVSALQSAKENPRVILFSLCACIGSLLWGYDIGELGQINDYVSPIADSLIRYQHHHNGPASLQASLRLRVPGPAPLIGDMELALDGHDLFGHAHR
jgi:hypothetical protein